MVELMKTFLGVPSFEAEFCARLLGEKIFFTEFMAFQSLATAKGYREAGRDKVIINFVYKILKISLVRL